MNQQTALRNSITSPLTPTSAASNISQVVTSQQSARDRRVSFNENEDVSASVTSNPPQDLEIIREDPDVSISLVPLHLFTIQTIKTLWFYFINFIINYLYNLLRLIQI